MTGTNSAATGANGTTGCRHGADDHRTRPRRRGAALVDAIHAAALAELTEHGYASLTMERVAARARTSKAALYRRWPSRADLVVDALRATGPGDEEPLDSGDLREDLLTVLRGAAARLTGPYGDVARALLAETLRDPGLTEETRTRVVADRQERFLRILRRAADRGQARPEAVTPLVAQVGPALLASHFLAHGAPIPDDVITATVDEVLLPLLRPTGRSPRSG